MKSLLVILGPLMLMMWASSSFLIHSLLGLPLGMTLLLGATITPTDPILAATIVEGSMAEKSLPIRLRETLAAEAGANDGFAYPLVMLAIASMEAQRGSFLGDWFLNDALWNIGGGITLGLLAGMALGKVFVYAERSRFVDQNALFGTTIALALLLMSLEDLLHINGLIAIFFAGRGFDRTAQPDAECKESVIHDATNQFFSVPIFTLFGLLIPFQEWQDLGIAGLLLVAGILLLRRMPWVLLLRPWISTLRNRREALIMGWFGPMGAAALYYASFATKRTDETALWNVGSLVVAGSIVIHGLSTMPLSRFLVARQQESPSTPTSRSQYGNEHAVERFI